MMNISLEQALQLLLDLVKNIFDNEASEAERIEERRLIDAIGQVVAEDIRAPFDNPPFNRSPLDGYSFRSEDTANATAENPARFELVAEECAGDYYDGPVKHGQAIRIMTGGAIPEDCDCVIRQEDVSIDGDGHLVVTCPMEHHQNFCFKGEDIKEGTLLVKKGTMLSAAYIGVIASMGMDKVKVLRPVRIAIASTGDELLQPGQPLEPGKIYNSNLFVYEARLREMGFMPKVIGMLKDDPDKAADVIRPYLGSFDLILTTGGVSVGKKDIMHEVIKKLDAERLFWRIAMKPGTPAIGYRVGNTVGIALSGNPFASYATFELLARPVLAYMSGKKHLLPTLTTGSLVDGFPKKSKGRRFVRGRYEDGKVYLPENHSSGSLFSSAGCNCFVDIPAGTPALLAGSKVDVMLFNNKF